MLEHVKYNTFENDKMELFNNFKKNDIPKEKKPFKISILFKLNTCMVTRGRKLILMYHGGFNFALYDCVKFEAALESLFYFHATR